MYTSVLIAALSAVSAYAIPVAQGSYGSQTSSAAATNPTALLGNPNAKPNLATPPGFVGELLTADNNIARFNDIREQLNAGKISLTFDFSPAANPNVKAGMGGQVDLASRANFPLLTNSGISAAGVFFAPCGLNTPHIHPRAAEFFTLTTDTKMLTGFVMENLQTAEFNTTLSQFQGTSFPQGSIHWQQNLGCAPAFAVAGLNSDDPGASSIAQNFLINTSGQVIDAALGFPSQINADNFAKFKGQIPPGLAKGVQECLTRCNIPY